MVARSTAGQQVERSILRQGQDSQQASSHSPMLSPAQLSLTVQNRGLKHKSFMYVFISTYFFASFGGHRGTVVSRRSAIASYQQSIPHMGMIHTEIYRIRPGYLW